ncbi:hypothetical protein [Mycobacterium arosiense]|uniref:hypothetical protein n=1 Tax=Mycobacterium arosiense TaxID=425468 RepID=UPI001301F280|nr:hypothetical protein [Mycobacterium arosiense]
MAPLLSIASLCIVTARVMAPLLSIASLCIVTARVMAPLSPASGWYSRRIASLRIGSRA